MSESIRKTAEAIIGASDFTPEIVLTQKPSNLSEYEESRCLPDYERISIEGLKALAQAYLDLTKAVEKYDAWLNERR